MFALGPAFFGTGEPLIPLGSILYAPFNSTTTSTDVITPVLSPTVIIPSSTSLTFDATKATFNTLSNPGAFPTAAYGSPYAETKISPAHFPSVSIVISAYINLTGINTGTVSAATVSEFLQLVYAGNRSNGNELIFGVYVELSTLYIRTRAQAVALNSNVYLTAPGPTAGVHKYSMEWTPDGGVIFRLDNEIVRYSQGTIRPTTDYPALLTVAGPSYGGASPGGIYEAAIRDVTYKYIPYVPVYSFTNSRHDGVYLSNAARTISTPNSGYGIITSISLSGKVYCEFAAISSPGTGMFNSFGVMINDPLVLFNFADNSGSFIYSRDDYAGGCGASGAGIWINGIENPDAAYRFTYGDRIGIAFDATTKQMWVRKNGVWINGDPETGTSPSATLTATGPFCFAMSNYACTSPAGTYVYTMYPNTAAMSSGVPAGFTAYDPL